MKDGCAAQVFDITNKYMEPRPKKKIIRRYEIVLAVFAFLLIAYVITAKYGCFLVNKTESEIEFTDGSSHDNLKRPEARKAAEPIDEETEAVVRDLAVLFANTKGRSNARTEGSMQRMGLTDDEKDYYKSVRAQNGFDRHIENAQTWFSVLKTAGQTYKTVQGILQTESPEDKSFYGELENRFGIPASLSKEFAKQGKSKVSDWALFVEENQ